MRDVIPYFEPFCTGYEVPIFTPAFTCEITIVNLARRKPPLNHGRWEDFAIFFAPSFSKLETLLQNIVAGIIECSQSFPSVKFDKKLEKIIWGIPDAEYEEQRQEKRRILHAQNIQAAETAMKEAIENGETVDPSDYEVGEISDDDNEDEEEYVNKLGGPSIPGIFSENPMVFNIRERISSIFQKTLPAVNALLYSFSAYGELYQLGVDDEIRKVANNISIKSLPECYDVVDHYFELRANIVEHCNHIEYLPRGLVEIRTFKLKNAIAARSVELARVVLDAAKSKVVALCNDLTNEYHDFEETLNGELNSSDDIYQMRLTIDDIAKRILPGLVKRFNGKEGIVQYIYFLTTFGHEIEQDYRIFDKANT